MLTGKAGYLMVGAGTLSVMVGGVLTAHKDPLAAIMVGAGALVGLVGYYVASKKGL